MTIRTAADDTQFAAALSASGPGDEIRLSPGAALGPTVINGGQFASAGLRIASADPAFHGSFRQLSLYNCAGITLEELTIRSDTLTNSYEKGLHLRDCSTITVSRCNLIGTRYLHQNPEAIALPPAQRTTGWGHALNYETSSDITIANCYFRHWKRGVVCIARPAASSRNITVRMCMFENVDGDRMVAAGLDGALFEDNYLVNARSNQTVTSPDHVDGIQGQVTGSGPNLVPPLRNITYRRNIMDMGNGHQSQICFIAHEGFRTGQTSDPAWRHANLTFEDNLGITRSTHGISVAATDGCTIRHNAVFRAPAANPDAFLNNNPALDAATVPDIFSSAEGGFGGTGAWIVENNFAGAISPPAGALSQGNLALDPSLSQVDPLYGELVLGFSASFNGAGDPYDPDHLNLIWPKLGGALAQGNIGPRWWLAGSFPGPGPYNTGTQPPMPSDRRHWGRVALSGSGAPAVQTLPGPEMKLRITVA